MVELMVALTVTVVVSSSALALLSAYQKVYKSNMMQADVSAGLLGIGELLTQEVSQAGLLNLTPTTLTAAVVGGPSQSVNVASTAGMFVGQKLLVDQELVSVTAVGASSVTGVFTSGHAAGAAVSSTGVFPSGVMSSSTGTRLELFGDLNADGTLVYVEYACEPRAGTLSRSTTPTTAASKTPAVVLLDRLVANPGGTPCFRYTSRTAAGLTFITSVSATVSIRTAEIDPQMRHFATETKSFLSLVPRNVLLGLSLASHGLTDPLQPTPPGLPMP